MARDLDDTIGTVVGRVGREAAESLMSKARKSKNGPVSGLKGVAVGTRMRIDLSKVAAAAVDAALADAQPRKRLTAPRAIVAGATLAIAARYAVTKAPSLPRVPALSAVPDGLRDHMPDGLRDRLAERGWLDNEVERDDEDLEADEPDVFDEGDEESDAAAAPEPDVEAEEEPAADVADEPDDEAEEEPAADVADEPDDEAEEEPVADVEDEADDEAEKEPAAEEDEEEKEPRRSRSRTTAKKK